MNEVRIESREDVSTYLARLKYALGNGAHISFQRMRRVDNNRDVRFTNDYTMNELFPNEDPQTVLRKELMSLTVGDYLRTVKDTRFPNKSEMREFGKVYNSSDEVYMMRYILRSELSCLIRAVLVNTPHSLCPFTSQKYLFLKNSSHIVVNKEVQNGSYW